MTQVRDEKWVKRRTAVERWKENNRGYYLEQKRQLAGRPEYLAWRREKYARSKAERLNLGGDKNTLLQNELTTSNETGP